MVFPCRRAGFRSESFPTHWRDQYSHNFLLEIGVEAGVLALAAASVVCYVAVRRQLRAGGGLVEAAMSALLVFALVNALVSGDVGDNRLLWVMLGAGLVAPPLWSGQRADRGAVDADEQTGSRRPQVPVVGAGGSGAVRKVH